MIEKVMYEILKLNNVLICIAVMSIITFLLMGYDKHEAKIHQWRISEKSLFLFSMLGGSLGGIIGMYVFHHKTKKTYFKIGFPLILILQVILLFYLIINKIITI